MTPNHFLIGRENPNTKINLSKEININLRKKWKSVQAAVEMFWRRWVREHLPNLTKRNKWKLNVRNFQPGDLVLISNKDISRSNWPLARILEVTRSDDNVVRVVKLKTKGGIYVRPAGCLCLLEASN